MAVQGEEQPLVTEMKEGTTSETDKETTTTETDKETTETETTASTIIQVGIAVYSPPYRSQYGIAVGNVLLDYHYYSNDNDNDNQHPTIELVNWYMELGHAHMDDTVYGVTFEDEQQQQQQYNKQYHVELAIQAYNEAASTLDFLTIQAEQLKRTGVVNDNDNTRKDSTTDGDNSNNDGYNDELLRLEYRASIEFAFGEAYAAMATAADGSNEHVNSNANTNDGSYYSSYALEASAANTETAVDYYRQAQSSYEKLRYCFSVFGTAKQQQQQQQQRMDDDDDEHDFFNQERYYSIEKGYALSSHYLGMALYRSLVILQNEHTVRANEKAIELMKSQFGGGLKADATEEEITAALLSQTQATAGNANAGSSPFASFETTTNTDEFMTDVLGDDGRDDEFAAKKEANLLEIEVFLDTAILTYQQHADYPPSNNNKKHNNKHDGLFKKSNGNNDEKKNSGEEIGEEERLFDWRTPLTLGYQNAAMIATTRNQHIRARELMNKALELYLEVICPYYNNYNNDANSNSKSRQRRSASTTTVTASTMTYEYAKVAVGDLYRSQTGTALTLGMYTDSKLYYGKAMDWYTQHSNIPSSPDGTYNTLGGDDVSMLQYDEFVKAYVHELEEYKRNVKEGYVYRDDMYEAEILVTVATMYMPMGKLQSAIRFYQDAVEIFRRRLPVSSNNNNNNDNDNFTMLKIAHAQSGLSSALYHAGRYTESKKNYQESLDIYQLLYGEGNPPKPEAETSLEDMKDEIIQNYGQKYYDQLKAQYDDAAAATGSATSGSGANGDGSKVTVTNNFALVGRSRNNETTSTAASTEENDDGTIPKVNSGEL